jgi:carbamoylphosphate synthase large subunit
MSRMKSGKIAIIGKFNVSLAEQIAKDGFEAVFFKDQRHSVNSPKTIACYPIDFSSKATVMKALKSLNPLNMIGTVAIYESYIPAQHWIATFYGVPHATQKAIEAATDKRLMRECFKKNAPHITPAFRLVRNKTDLESFATAHGFPLMMKPTNLMKSLLVTRNDTLPELLKNYRNTIKNIKRVYEKEGAHRTPNIIIEECLIGSFHSIDAFVDTKGAITTLEPVDLVMGTDIGFDDTFNYLRILPSRLAGSETTKAKRLAIDAINAIGLTNSPAHIEFVFTKDGPKIIEIGARVGGYRPRLYQASFGIDMLRAQIAVGQGKSVALKKTGETKQSALFEIFPEERGHLHSIHSINKLTSRKSVTYVSVKRRFGESIGPAKDGYRAAAVIFLVNEDPAVFQDDLDFVKKNIRVRLMRK